MKQPWYLMLAVRATGMVIILAILGLFIFPNIRQYGFIDGVFQNLWVLLLAWLCLVPVVAPGLVIHIWQQSRHHDDPS